MSLSPRFALERRLALTMGRIGDLVIGDRVVLLEDISLTRLLVESGRRLSHIFLLRLEHPVEVHRRGGLSFIGSNFGVVEL
jgi:hypothetical protein